MNSHETYIETLSKVNREGIKELIEWLKYDSDFFMAPASTKTLWSYKGGLCDHCLCTLKWMQVLNNSLPTPLPEESIIVVALLHELSKCNYYVPGYNNQYKVNENAFVYGNLEETSEFMARQFIELTMDESVALLHHKGALGFDSVPSSVTNKVFMSYPLAAMLHAADTLCAYVDPEARHG